MVSWGATAGADADHLRWHGKTDREFQPREVLAQVLARLAPQSIFPVVAFKLEFYLFDSQLRDGLPQFARDPLTGDADDQPNMHIERL